MSPILCKDNHHVSISANPFTCHAHCAYRRVCPTSRQIFYTIGKQKWACRRCITIACGEFGKKYHNCITEYELTTHFIFFALTKFDYLSNIITIFSEITKTNFWPASQISEFSSTEFKLVLSQTILSHFAKLPLTSSQFLRPICIS